MKRFLVLFYAISAFGAPVGNPAAPSLLQEGLFIPDTTWCQPKMSFLGDFTTSSNLSCTSSPFPVNKTTMDGNAQLGVLTWSIDERFDASVVMGSGTNHFHLYDTDEVAELKASGGFIWYGQGKLVLIEMKDTAFSIFGAGGGSDWMRGPYSVGGENLPGAGELSMRFWEAGAAFTQKFRYFAPYLGIIVLHSRWKVTSPTAAVFRFIEEYPNGPVVGCSFSTNSKLLLNIEWRGVVENSWTASGEIRF